MRIRYWTVFLAFWVSMTPAAAEEAGSATPKLGLGLGGFLPKDNAVLVNRSGGLTFSFDAIVKRTPWHSIGFDFFSFYSRFDTPSHLQSPLFGTLDSRASLTGGGFSASSRAHLPVGRIELHAGAGIGVFFSRLRVSGATFGLPGSSEQRSTDIGWQLMAGFSHHALPRRSWGLEWRYLNVQADFGTLTNGSVQIGGQSVMLFGRLEG